MKVKWTYQAEEQLTQTDFTYSDASGKKKGVTF